MGNVLANWEVDAGCFTDEVAFGAAGAGEDEFALYFSKLTLGLLAFRDRRSLISESRPMLKMLLSAVWHCSSKLRGVDNFGLQ